MKGLYRFLVSSVLFPLHEKLKGHNSLRVRRELERTQWLDRDAQSVLQNQRLREFLIEIGIYVPYYKHLFSDLGFEPASVRGVGDLRVLPLLDKDTIRRHTNELRSKRAGQLVQCNTGGSTGKPLVFLLGKKRISHDVGAKWRATRWWDVDIGDKEVVLWGSPIELGAQDRLRRIRDTVLRSRLLPAFDLNEETLQRYVKFIQQFKPRMLFGYPSVLAHLAAYARKKSIAMDRLGIKVAFVTSERLYDEQRKIIEEVFSCSVANGYGSRDAGFIAHECPQGSMHIMAEDIVLECVDNAGQPVEKGVLGEIVVTHLSASEYPFLRYRTGDMAVMSDELCPCGRGLPILKEIHGRTTDFITASDGTVMHGLALIYVLRDMPAVDEFKIVQQTLHMTEVYIVPNCEYSEVDTRHIVEKFKHRLGQDVNIVVRNVSAIRREETGKYRYVISHVESSPSGLLGYKQ